jgi:allantoin racemase
MKICYLGSCKPYSFKESARRRRILESFKSVSDFSIMMLEPSEGPLAIETPEDKAAAIPGLIELARRHEKECDVYFTGCFGDVGISELRKVLSVPIIGSGRISYAVAAAAYPAFEILTINSNLVAEETQKIESLGLSDQVTTIKELDLRVVEIIDYPERAMQKIVNEARDCHAPAIILGCMSLAFLFIERRLMELDGVFVVNPLQCAIRIAFGMVV